MFKALDVRKVRSSLHIHKKIPIFVRESLSNGRGIAQVMHTTRITVRKTRLWAILILARNALRIKVNV